MKSRNSFFTVNLDVIAQNIRVLQGYFEPGARQMAVIKADAYGHGAVQVARKIASLVDWLAVNDIEEGIELRKNDIENPILVFGVPETEFAARYKQHNLTATVSSAVHFDILPAGSCYHLNFDTGMGRLGFRPGQADEVASLKTNHPKLKCTGIYSHFATADEPNSGKPGDQLKLFKDIRHRFGSKIVGHLCNTAGMIRCPEAQLDMVRTGIGLYGYAPGKITIPGLAPAMSWQTRLVEVKPVKKGETVSYGATWQAKEDGFIGIIPVGYADGIPRGLSGNFGVTIQGSSYEVRGTVTMNFCMIDVGTEEMPTGIKVELWNNRHDAGTWAKRMRTISYEILTGVSPRIPKKYVG